MTWWRFLAAAELRKILAFRADFWVTFIGQALVQLLIARALWQSIFAANETGVMNGFTLQTMTLYYLIVPIGQKILTGENVGFLSREIYDGTFSRYLIYPLSFFQYKATTYLTHSAFYGIQLVLIFSVYNLLTGTTGFTTLVPGILLFLVAAFAYMSIAMIVELLALWADNIWSLMVLVRFFCLFFGGGYVPLTFFPETVQRALVYTPFPYLVSLPVRTTMGLAQTHEIVRGSLVLLLWALLFHLGAQLIWTRGQYKYTGVGI